MIYQPGKYLRVFYEGFGNVNYEFPAAGGGGVVLTAADDGLSTDALTGKTAQLGQTVGRVGDPAALTEDREIPDAGGFTLFIGKNDGVSNVIGLNPDGGIDVSNTNGRAFLYFDTFKNFTIDMLSATDISFGFGSDRLSYDTVTKKFIFSSSVQVTGLAAAITPESGSVTVTPTRQNFGFLQDTTVGNVNYVLDPAVLSKHIFWVKKTTADVNTITLTPTSGTIQDIGAPAASFAFNNQGETIMVHCDGTNFYII
jgi:hypothetical protein